MQGVGFGKRHGMEDMGWKVMDRFVFGSFSSLAVETWF
jgi:hypothetical protein